MRYLILIVAMVVQAWGATCAVRQTGNWSDKATWGTGSGCVGAAALCSDGTSPCPGSGDTITDTAYVLTIDGTYTIGIGGAAGTAAITLSAAGSQLVWASGASLTASGDITNTLDGASNFTDWLVATSGANLTFDTTGGNRAINPNSLHAFRAMNWNCSAGTQCTLGATGANVASLTTASTYTGNIKLYNVSVTGWGSAAANAFLVKGNSANTGDWYAVGSTFISCGVISYAPGSMLTNMTFLHDGNNHVGSLGTTVITLLTLGSSIGTGTRQITNNSFDKSMEGAGYDLKDFTITDNYFGATPFSASGSTGRDWASYARNFINITSQDSAVYSIDNSYIYYNADTFNPHWAVPKAGASITNSIFELATKTAGDSGEVNTALGVASGLLNNIILPDSTGIGHSELATVIQTGTAMTLNHNTIIGSNGFGMVDFSENTAITPLGGLASLRSNVVWYPDNSATFYKSFDAGGTAASGDPCNPLSNCDYNLAWNYTVNQAACSACSPHPSTNGYNLNKWSSAEPGSHDLNSVNPMFPDWRRGVARFSKDYLGISANKGAWSSASVSYVVGDVVTETNAGKYGGVAVNYRCIANHTSGATTEPGIGASWRTAWELDTLYRLRVAAVAKTRYTDLGAANLSMPALLVQWVRRAYIPANPAIWCAGHDGETVGAVPFCAAGKAMIGAVGVF